MKQEAVGVVALALSEQLERFSVDVNRNSKGVPRGVQIRFELLWQQRRGRAMAKGYTR